MPGTKAGGLKAAKTNKKRQGKDFYAKIGALGGSKKGIVKGFALNPKLARKAGAKGGKKSRRTGIKNGEGKKHQKEQPKKKGLLERIFGDI